MIAHVVSAAHMEINTEILNIELMCNERIMQLLYALNELRVAQIVNFMHKKLT